MAMGGIERRGEILTCQSIRRWEVRKRRTAELDIGLPCLAAGCARGYRYERGGYMDSCSRHLAQRPLKKIKITLKTLDHVHPEVARSLLLPSPLSSCKPPPLKKPWPLQIWRRPIARRL
jgi:hypothetical protein